jgi:Protein of unknown function (DUF3828)
MRIRPICVNVGLGPSRQPRECQVAHRIRILIATGAVALCGLGEAATRQTPKEVVSEVYRIYAGPKGDFNSCAGARLVDCTIDGARVQRLLTRDFQTALQKFNKSNTEGLGADPVIETNGISTLTELTITPDPGARDTDVVTVTFYQSADRQRTKHRLLYDMRREGGQWRIDDIRSDLTGDLRKQIATQH